MPKLNAQQFIVCKCSENCKTCCHLPLLVAAATAQRQRATSDVALSGKIKIVKTYKVIQYNTYLKQLVHQLL